MSGTIWSLLPPIVAIALALITKEVYVSLLIGILAGGALFTGFHPLLTAEVTFDIMGSKMGSNINILIFLALLGIVVSLITKSGASKAYGDWASQTIKSKKGALFATIFPVSYTHLDVYKRQSLCWTVSTAALNMERRPELLEWQEE